MNKEELLYTKAEMLEIMQERDNLKRALELWAEYAFNQKPTDKLTPNELIKYWIEKAKQ